MKITRCFRFQCKKSFSAKCATLLIWLVMSLIVISAFIFNNGDILIWTNKNPAINIPLLLIATIVYVGFGFWLLCLNFCEESEQ